MGSLRMIKSEDALEKRRKKEARSRAIERAAKRKSYCWLEFRKKILDSHQQSLEKRSLL